MDTETNSKWYKLVIELAIILFAAAVAWATISKSVEDNCIDIKEHEQRLKGVEQTLPKIEGDIKVIRVEQKYILEGINDIKDKLK